MRPPIFKKSDSGVPNAKNRPKKGQSMLTIFYVDENVHYASAYVQMTLEKVLVSHVRSQKSKSIDNLT